MRQVQAKHREFLDEEERLSLERDHNAATIASLRRDFARARHALEEALHVESTEAEAYLALLSAGVPDARPLGEGPGMVTASEGGLDTSDDDDNHPGRTYMDPPPPLSPPSFAHESERPSSGTPPNQSPSRGTVTPSSVDILPPPPERPTSHIGGHPFQAQQGYYRPDTSPYRSHGGAVPTSSNPALDRSEWRDPDAESLDRPGGGAEVKGMHPELQRNGGRWSRVFPGLVRRMSSSQARA